MKRKTSAPTGYELPSIVSNPRKGSNNAMASRSGSTRKRAEPAVAQTSEPSNNTMIELPAIVCIPRKGSNDEIASRSGSARKRALSTLDTDPAQISETSSRRRKTTQSVVVELPSKPSNWGRKTHTTDPGPLDLAAKYDEALVVIKCNLESNRIHLENNEHLLDALVEAIKTNTEAILSLSELLISQAEAAISQAQGERASQQPLMEEMTDENEKTADEEQEEPESEEEIDQLLSSEA
ncbi:hypothetical protein BDN70DRAFT_939721 [Pholiota conissans]|uniref:Uncharacterized protein n=1 Tax=Pholiota conissans TaxID=109636 RepID=A0A9P5YKT7_9AGAR|nr:hypothetical protein BDN70DRAFT_939721 [Pholiota conissans]